MHLIHNEQVKLTATALNAAAAGLVVVGLISPIVATTDGMENYRVDTLAVIRLVLWFGIALTLHFMARNVLTGLRDE